MLHPFDVSCQYVPWFVADLDSGMPSYSLLSGFQDLMFPLEFPLPMMLPVSLNTCAAVNVVVRLQWAAKKGEAHTHALCMLEGELPIV